jgi:hypothetical protein
MAARPGGTISERRGHAWLIAHHPGFFPLLGDTATILGTVVALLRRV